MIVGLITYHPEFGTVTAGGILYDDQLWSKNDNETKSIP